VLGLLASVVKAMLFLALSIGSRRPAVSSC